VALENMDLNSLQMHLEEQQKITDNAQIAFDFAKKETANAKKKCQHEKKKLKTTQDDHTKKLQNQQKENEKVDNEHETVTVPAEKESVQKTLVGEFEKNWPGIMKDLKKNKKMKPDEIAAEQNRMKKRLMRRIEIEQEKCVLKNEVRKEKAATDLHVTKMKFKMEERVLAHDYHRMKFLYSKAQEDEKEAEEALEKENTKLAEIEALVEKVIAAQKAEEERLRKQKEAEEEELRKAGASEAELAASVDMINREDVPVELLKKASSQNPIGEEEEDDDDNGENLLLLPKKRKKKAENEENWKKHQILMMKISL